MQIEWRDLLAALALYLVLEGVLPFLSPNGVRRAFTRMIEMNDVQLRVTGLLSMLAGVALLFYVRG